MHLLHSVMSSSPKQSSGSVIPGTVFLQIVRGTDRSGGKP